MINQDGSLNGDGSANNSSGAAPGSVIALYATGLGDIQSFQLQAGETNALRQTLREAQVAVKERFEDQERELSNRRAPWWTIASLIIAGASVGWIIFGPAIIALP